MEGVLRRNPLKLFSENTPQKTSVKLVPNYKDLYGF